MSYILEEIGGNYPGIKRSAVFSPCRTWRYVLERHWDEDPKYVVFCLLNPSTADAEKDDPTNRRGINYAKRWGFTGVIFVNLFSYRTPYPKELKKAEDPIGPDNDFWIMYHYIHAEKFIAAWGTHGSFLERDKYILNELRCCPVEKKLWCLGKTKGGHPKHPLYLRNDQELIIF